MSRPFRPALAALLLLACIAPPLSAADDRSVGDYERRVRQLREGELRVDFQAMRVAFTQTDAYLPYEVRDAEAQERTYAAIEAGEFDDPRVHIEQLLEQNFVNPENHMLAIALATRSGDATMLAFHQQVLDGLLGSVCPDPDSGSVENPCAVITAAEEYFYLRANNLEIVRQRLHRCDSGPCDRMEVREIDGSKEMVLYFGVSAPMEWMKRRLDR